MPQPPAPFGRKDPMDNTHQYVAQRVIAFCAAYVDVHFDPTKTPAINTDELIAAACKQFAITGRPYQETFEMREGYCDNPEVKQR